MPELTIPAAAQRNAQVSDNAKELIYTALKKLGLEEPADSIVLHHYFEGEYVAISNQDADEDKFASAATALIQAHDDNREINEGCLWVSRDWVHEVAADDS